MFGVYARQSIEKKDSLSIQSQVETCLKRVDKTREECKIYSDEGYTGANLNRPGFIQMMQDIRNGLIEVVVVYKLDRISRSLLDFFQIYKEFEKYKVEFISCNEQFDTSTPMGKAMLSIIVVFAELERETIQLRVRDNYYARGEKGFYLGGRPPFGYSKVKTEYMGKKTYKLVLNEKQAGITKMLFEEYANTDIAYGQLVKRLNQDGITTNNGNAWTSVQVGRLIRNPVYVRANPDVYLYYKNKGAKMNNDVVEYNGLNGCYLYAERKGVKTMKFTDVSKSFVTLAPHEGLIDADTWLRCQYKAEKNKTIKNSGKGTHTWLTGLLKCGYCGCAVTAVNGYKDILYINCGGRRRGTCNGRKKVVYVKDIEEIVECEIIEKLRTLKNRNSAENTKDKQKLDELKGKIITIDEQINTYVASLADISAVSVKYVDQKINELHKDKLAVQAEMDKILKEQMNNQIDITDLNAYADNWHKFSFDQKKTVAKQIIEKIKVTDDEIHIDYRL